MILTKVAIFLLWLGAVFDPVGDLYNIRYIALGTAATTLLLQTANNQIDVAEKSYRVLLIIVLAIVMPIYGTLLYSFKGGSSNFIDTSYLASGLLITTSLLYRNYNFCLFGARSLVFSTRLLSVTIVAEFLSQNIYPNDLIYFFVERGGALISFREYSGIRLPYIYFLASPLLILLLGYDLNKILSNKSFLNIFCFFISSLSLALTGTRAHMIISILFVPLYLLMQSSLLRILKHTSLLIGVIFLFLLFKDSRDLLLSFFSTSESSNSAKLSYLDGYAAIFSNPFEFFLGQGFNAHEWSTEFREMVGWENSASKTELTYIELFRVFGPFISTILLLAIFFAIKSSRRLTPEMRWLYPSFTIYLLNSALNPYLFSAIGMLSLGLFTASIYYSNTSKASETAGQV